MNDVIEKIKKDTIDSFEFLDELSDYIDGHFSLPGEDKTKFNLKQWKDFFRIEIPEEITFPILISLSGEVARKYQQASYFRDKQQIQLAILEQSRSDKYNLAYNQTRRDSEEKFKKPLAAESCKIAAILAVNELDEALKNQRVIKDFWDGTCKTLTEVRKILETIGFALSGDARIQREYVVKGN